MAPGDIIDELSHAHRGIEELFARIERLLPGDAQRRGLAEQAIIKLVAHAAVEERHFYPIVRRYLPGGDATADRGIEDHARAEHLMKKLEGASAGEPRYDALLEQLASQVWAHIQDEEHHLFPQLRTVIPSEDLLDLGEQVRRAEKTAPPAPL
ncbi:MULTISPECIES: hemerythrin domain-containing protein [Streptomyces]|uniref:hemerythrin domain-containing protein n=1 Tax=Streptomyces TaxID=1883 RepID=UPI0022AEB744|nr:hemerythrin domain-containing protein [Streptomyces sp. H39-C1]MCZ4103478.1 hemerythrin domain-containing protein [Streptomyces sp. H39-C1]